MEPSANQTPQPSHENAAITVRVDHDGRDTWLVWMPKRSEPVVCTTLSEAKQLAYRYAGHQRPCELIVRDAYHRVRYREHINDHRNSRDRHTRARRKPNGARSD